MSKLQKVLIVDASRVVRTSLAKSLKGHFEFVEDVDGESAWQTLVLDSSVVAVISGNKLALLDGIGLVERMRENRLCRLNRMPFFLLVSESFSPEEQRGAALRGVSGCIPKGMAAAEMIALLKRFVEQLPLVKDRQGDSAGTAGPDGESAGAVADYLETGVQSLIGTTDIMGQLARLAEGADASHDEHAPEKRVFLSAQGVNQHLRELLPADAPGRPVGLLVFGIDGYDSLVARYGSELAERVEQKISGLLANKIRGEDRIGYLAPGRIAIIALHTNVVLCAGFAKRVCTALAAAQISLRGQRVGLTLSVGVATLPDDGAGIGAGELLRLANERVDAAMKQGGNQVLAGNDAAGSAATGQQEFLGRLRDLLAATGPEAMAPCLADIGLQIMPILKQIEQTFHFGLPVEDMQRRLGESARHGK
jgi:diguanylate cyclase (GGDEF)-like protein